MNIKRAILLAVVLLPLCGRAEQVVNTISSLTSVPIPAADTLVALYTNNGSGSFRLAKVTIPNLLAAAMNTAAGNISLGRANVFDATADNAIVIGNANGPDQVFGSGIRIANASGGAVYSGGISIGHGSGAGPNCIGIGSETDALANNAVAVGPHVIVNGDYSIMVGGLSGDSGWSDTIGVGYDIPNITAPGWMYLGSTTGGGRVGTTNTIIRGVVNANVQRSRTLVSGASLTNLNLYSGDNLVADISALSFADASGNLTADLSSRVLSDSSSTDSVNYETRVLTGNWSVTGNVILESGVTIKVGSGTPEGAVTAIVGSLFLRLDGGAGTTLYVKQSGTGNTGWVGK